MNSQAVWQNLRDCWNCLNFECSEYIISNRINVFKCGSFLNRHWLLGESWTLKDEPWHFRMRAPDQSNGQTSRKARTSSTPTCTARPAACSRSQFPQPHLELNKKLDCFIKFYKTLYLSINHFKLVDENWPQANGVKHLRNSEENVFELNVAVPSVPVVDNLPQIVVEFHWDRKRWIDKSVFVVVYSHKLVNKDMTKIETQEKQLWQPSISFFLVFYCVFLATLGGWLCWLACKCGWLADWFKWNLG